MLNQYHLAVNAHYQNVLAAPSPKAVHELMVDHGVALKRFVSRGLKAISGVGFGVIFKNFVKNQS